MQRKLESKKVNVQPKHSWIRNNKCLSFCCFVCGCVGGSVVEAEKKPPGPLTDEEELRMRVDESPSFEPFEDATFVGSSYKPNNDATFDKLKDEKKDPGEEWA